jgi:hypothetical protein
MKAKEVRAKRAGASGGVWGDGPPGKKSHEAIRSPERSEQGGGLGEPPRKDNRDFARAIL